MIRGDGVSELFGKRQVVWCAVRFVSALRSLHATRITNVTCGVFGKVGINVVVATRFRGARGAIHPFLPSADQFPTFGTKVVFLCLILHF